MIRKNVTVVKIRFPTGREEEIYGSDYGPMRQLRKAFEKGAVIVERRKDLYHLLDEDFLRIAKYVKTPEREESK